MSAPVRTLGLSEVVFLAVYSHFESADMENRDWLLHLDRQETAVFPQVQSIGKPSMFPW
jgi:hypothetical protein